MDQVLFWDTTLYSYLWLFLIYSFIGWCAEVAAHAVTKGKFINRGFLNGPYCPIYGFGMVIVIICLTPFEKNLLILFAGSVVLTTVLEFVTAFTLEKAFHTKWWDYSNQKFNIGGYICLKYSILWGGACVFVLKLLDPGMMALIDLIPQIAGQILIAIFLLGMIADFITVAISLTKMNKRMRRAAHIRETIHNSSDKIGGKIADEVLDIQSKIDKLPDKKSAIEKRLEKAYPNFAKLNKDITKEDLTHLLKKLQEEGGKVNKAYKKVTDISKKNR